MKKKKLTAKELVKKGVPYILIPGLLAALTLGLQGATLQKIKDYYQNKQLFPSSGYVSQIEDGDTFVLKSGIKVRLIGIDAPDRGQKNFDLARGGLAGMINEKKVFLEYDRYQDDKYGRILAWVWVNCETTPHFLPSDYMHKSGSESMPGLTENPNGCKKGKLINEELVKSKLAVPVVYKDRGELKYEKRLQNP